MKKIIIHWGTDKEDWAKQTYTFENEEQLKYFMMGVDESNGWLEYEVEEYPNLTSLNMTNNLQAYRPLVLSLNLFLLNRLFDCQNKDTHDHAQRHQRVYGY